MYSVWFVFLLFPQFLKMAYSWQLLQHFGELNIRLGLGLLMKVPDVRDRNVKLSTG